MESDQFERIRRYIGFDEHARELLLELHTHVAPHIHEVVDDFYAAILSDPDTARLLANERPQIERLKVTLAEWLNSALTGPYDAAWVERRSRIGLVHVRIGLPQRFMITAMSRIRVRLVQIAQRAYAHDTSERIAIVLALHRLLDLELAIQFDAYQIYLIDKIQSAERLATIGQMEAVPALVLGLDSNDKIVVWNRRLEEVTGFSREEMLDRPGRELIEPGADRKLELKDGGHRLVRWQLAHRSDLGAPRPITYAVGIDVTEEAQMLRRTMRAERLAAVGTLAAGLAHEVRNPLNSAALQLQVLRRRIERGQTSSDMLLPVVGVVTEEISRLDRLVSDFLSFARPRRLSLEPTELLSLVQSVAHQIRTEAEAAGITVELHADANLGTIEADSAALRQVLWNLMRNAIEAMGKSGKLTIRAQPADDLGFVSVAIEDSGPGISEDAPIFDAFYTTKEAGTGLGLAIVHRIVQEHGGVVHFESKPGQTSFTVKLPKMASELASNESNAL